MNRWMKRRTGQRRGYRRGAVFPVRLTDDERSALERARADSAGPEGLGPFMVWAAQRAAIAGVLPARGGAQVIPCQAAAAGGVLPAPASRARVIPGPGRRIVLDLCAGSGAWSAPYERAGYAVVRVTLPDVDVRQYAPPAKVWGVLAAPPCDQFSLARNGRARDFAGALEVVTACLRVIALARPRWWAVENPVGLLSRWLGTPRDVWEPYEFGDPWTKRTALWGHFVLPSRGPFVQPTGSAMDRRTPAARAITPPGFASAFFAANP